MKQQAYGETLGQSRDGEKFGQSIQLSKNSPAPAKKPELDFSTGLHHHKLSYLLRTERDRPPGRLAAPQVIVLDVEPGVAPSGKTPVRIFMGTEAAQFRAERVLIWSIMKHRDLSRRYEIHLMKDLLGFDRRKWKTGFTRYRYAIPVLAGSKGRAIYNDVDQIYLADPAELFDLDMNGKGQLGINESENSVMLLDCESMSRIWEYSGAQQGKKHRDFRAAVHAAGLWGLMPGVWNARDAEYVAGESKLLHFTTLQTQPWQPFPHQLRYQDHPLSEVWSALEREADAAGFTVFTKERPSERYAELLKLHQQLGHSQIPETGSRAKSRREDIEAIAALIREAQARTVLDYGVGVAQFCDPAPGEAPDSGRTTMPGWDGVQVTGFDPARLPVAATDEQVDGVICLDQLPNYSDDDIPWVLDELFRRARRFVYVSVACDPAPETLPNGENSHVTVQPASWWREQMEAASHRRTGVRWTLSAQRSNHGWLLPQDQLHEGGGAARVS